MQKITKFQSVTECNRVSKKNLEPKGSPSRGTMGISESKLREQLAPLAWPVFRITFLTVTTQKNPTNN